MKHINVMSDLSFVHNGSIFLYNGKKVIANVDPAVAAERKGTCKSNSVYISFISNSPTIAFKYSVVNRMLGDLTHTGISVQCGIAYSYRVIDEDKWHNLDCYLGREEKCCKIIPMNKYVRDNKYYEIRIYAPSFSYLGDVVVAIEDEYDAVPVDKGPHKVCFLGGLATFGTGVTSSTLMFTNLMTRRYQIEVKNISFYFWNWMDKLKPFLEKTSEQIQDCDLVFLECDASTLSLEVLKHNLEEITVFLLENTKAKVVLWNQPICYDNKTDEKKHYIENMVNNLMEKYPCRIKLNDSYSVWDEQEIDYYSNDANYLNDNGNIYIYNRLKNNVEELCRNI